MAAELLSTRTTRIVAGPWSADRERDPLAAWFKASTTLLEHGLLGCFRRGWQKHYVEYLDAALPALLPAMLEAGTVSSSRSPSKLDARALARAYEMSDRGVSGSEIARTLGVSGATISRLLAARPARAVARHC